jgi:acetyl-CoA C-acetyltransferase
VSKPLQRALLDLHKARNFGEKWKALSGITLKSLRPRIPNVNEPRTLLSMGQHTELMVKEWKISREEQDAFALASHKNGAKAYDSGFYNDLVHPFAGLKRDGTLRGDTSIEKLSKLKPAFDPVNGSLTAGNSSPLTDGAAVVLVGNEAGAKKTGATPLARLVDVQVAAVNFVAGEGLLMAPTKAIASLLKRNNLTLEDIDYFELHEAFAGQVLSNIKALESEEYSRRVLGWDRAVGGIDLAKVNLVGSSIALGHPFAATGARITGSLAKILSQNPKKRGLISLCTAGGMGIAAILESV